MPYFAPSTPSSFLVVKAADESVDNSAVLQDDDELVFAATANKTYMIEVRLLLTTATTAPDWKFGWTVPAGAVIYWAPEWVNISGSVQGVWAGLAVSTNAVTLPTTGTVSFGGTTVGLVHGVHFFALLTMGSTAGNIQLQWSQNTQTASAACVVKAGSMLRYQTTQ